MAENKKLVFIDAENKTIKIIDREVREYSWDQTSEISGEISGLKIYYVSALDEVLGDDVISMLSQHTGLEYRKIKRTGKRYIRSTRKGKVILRSESDESLRLEFNGEIDFKEESKAIYKDFPNIKIYLDKGVLEIIDESDISRIRKRVNSERNEEHSKIRSNKDKSLDKILVQDSAINLADKIKSDGYEDDDFAEQMDITHEVNDPVSANDEEFFKTARDLGIDTDEIEND